MTTLFGSETKSENNSFFGRHKKTIGITFVSIAFVSALIATGLYLAWPKLSYRIWGLRSGMSVDQVVAALGEPTYRLSCDETLCIAEGSQGPTKGSEDCAATLAKVHTLPLANVLKISTDFDASLNVQISAIGKGQAKPSSQLDLDKTPCATGHLPRYTKKDEIRPYIQESWPRTSLIYKQGQETFRAVDFNADGWIVDQTDLQYRGPLPENKALNLAAFGLVAGRALSGPTKVFSFPGCSALLTLAWQPQTPGPQRPDDVRFYINESAFDRYQCADSWEVKRVEHYPGFDWPALPGAHPPSEDFLVLESHTF